MPGVTRPGVMMSSIITPRVIIGGMITNPRPLIVCRRRLARFVVPLS